MLNRSNRGLREHISNKFRQAGFGLNFSKKQRRIRGSPPYVFRNDNDIVADGTVIINFDEDNTTHNGMDKYKPFSDMEIANNSSEVIWIYINQDRGKTVTIMPQTIKNVENFEFGGIWSIEIHNKSVTTASADEITLTVWKRPPEEKQLLWDGLKKLWG